MLATEVNPQNWGRRMNECSVTQRKARIGQMKIQATKLEVDGCTWMTNSIPKCRLLLQKIRPSARPKLGDFRLWPPE
ncbi:hypothetical protein B0H12DRAFT_1103309 [Mycena haematopus]|nr:hypothetical protein B0H12DRAFT_1103309 [Mycena haematopus]